MEKVNFLCIFSCWILQSAYNVQGSSDVIRAQKGANISLNCSMENRDEIAWYLLRAERLILLTAAEKDESGRKLLMNYNPNSPRLKLTDDTWITSASLIITGVTESDSGLYFCGTKSDVPEMFFDKPIRLEIEGLFVTEEMKVEVDITDEVTSKERALMFGGLALAIVVFFLTTIIAGGIIHHRGWQKGWSAAKHSTLTSHE